MRDLSAYVMQLDVLPATATVKEMVTFSAMLKLPRDLPASVKCRRVDRIVEDLDLLPCADTLIGDDAQGTKGISGGQRRRTSLAMEMVKDPLIVFLDEPTSGLDAEMALSVLNSLHTLSQRGRTVALTVHQPSGQVAALFDDLLLMAKGNVIYCGAYLESVPWMASQGYPVQEYMNPTESFLLSLKAPEAVDALAGAWHDRGAALLETGSPDALFQMMQAKTARKLRMCTTLKKDVPEYVAPKLSTQVWMVFRRSLRRIFRFKAFLIADLAVHVVIALLLGILFWDIPSKPPVSQIYYRANVVWLSIAFLSFYRATNVYKDWFRERPLVRREHATGLYTMTCYFFAREMIYLPLIVLLTLLFSLIVYPMVGLVWTGAALMIFWSCIMLSCIIGGES